MNGQCSCGYRPGRISSIDCRCVTHRELNERLKTIDPDEGFIQKEIDELKATKQDKLIAGTNITIEGRMISADLDSTNFYNKTETDGLLAGKQDTLTAGENIVISENNVISADAHMLVTLTPTGAPVGGVTDYAWTSEHTYAELVASLDKVAFKTTEAGSENILVPTELYEALEDSQNVIFGMIPSNDPSVPKITNLELIVRPDGTAKTTESNSLLQPKLTAGTNITIDTDNVISAASLTKADLLTLLGVEEINVNIEDDQGNPRTATVLGIFTS